MTENTHQQIEIRHSMNPQSVDFPRETVQNKENQRAQFTHVAPRITEEKASCRSKPLQGKRTKRRELQAKHTRDSELACSIEKVALAVLQALLYAMAREITLAANWMSGRSRARYKRLMQLLRNSTRRFSSRKGPASGFRTKKFGLSQGIGLPLLDTVSPYAAMSRSACL